MAPTAEEWIVRFAEALGKPAPDEDTMEAILELASVAAHSSERKAAPIACWLPAGGGRARADRLLARGGRRPRRGAADRRVAQLSAASARASASASLIPMSSS